jgi:hypothetical protein
MPLQKMQLIAGINKESTNYGNEGGWYDCDKVRFRSGNPEKIGGWTRYSSNQFVGTARHLWNWVDLNNSNWLGIGTNAKYYVERGGIYYDITPLRATRTALSGIFNTSTTSTTVTVNITAHGALSGDYVTFSGATGVDPRLNAEFVVTYVNGNTFTITLPTNATSTVTGGGGAAITAAFQIASGTDSYVAGSGWSAGSWPSTVPVSLTGPFASTLGGTTITVTHTGHGLSNGSYVQIVSIGDTTPCGIPKEKLIKAHQITFINANSYSISVANFTTLTTTASSGAGGTVTLNYPDSNITNYGWGSTVGGSTISNQLRLWTAENYGSYLIFAIRGGDIYYWDQITVSTTAARAITLSAAALAASASYTNVPTQTDVVICSNERFVLLFGTQSYIGATFDPMLVRWSDQGNPFQWEPSVTNQSGEYRLSHGSKIIQVVQTRQETLIFTDSALYSMQYQGPPYVWGFQLLMDNISIISPNAAYTVNGVTYWMGIDKFYMYNGTVATLPCTVKQYVFEDMNYSQAFQFFVGGNSGYNEVWWFYSSAYEQDTEGNAVLDSGGNPVPNTQINKYVIYNYLDNVWYIGSMSRTAWLDSGLRQYPMAADYNGRILNHENGVDDESGESAERIYSYITSSEFDIGDGQSFGYIWRILPDINFNASNINNPEAYIALYPRRNSGADYDPTKYTTAYNPDTAYNPYAITSRDNYSKQPVYTVQQFDGQIYTRIRARQVMFKLQSNGVGVAWQLGAVRLDVKPDGRR